MQSSATVRIRDCTVGGMWLFRIRMSSRNERVDTVCQPAGAGHVDFEREKKGMITQQMHTRTAHQPNTIEQNIIKIEEGSGSPMGTSDMDQIQPSGQHQ